MPDNVDVIHELAEREGNKLRITRLPDDENDANSDDDVNDNNNNRSGTCEEDKSRRPFPTASWIDIGCDPSHSGVLRASGHGHRGHDNEPRMTVLCSFLNRRVLPYLEGSGGFAASVSGRYTVELHDSYTYLPRRRQKDADTEPLIDDATWDKMHANTLVFSRRAEDACPSLIPDPFQMTNYSGELERIVDDVKWQDKKPAMFFAGTTTGHRDPRLNERVRRCIWSLRHRDVAHYYLTAVAQIKPQDMLAMVKEQEPELPRVFHNRFPEGHHKHYRIAANVAGNTCSWSRVPAVLKTCTVLFDYPQTDVQWFSPVLKDGTHLVRVDDDSVLAKFYEYVNDEARCKEITREANRFVASYAHPIFAAIYFKHLLHTAALASK